MSVTGTLRKFFFHKKNAAFLILLSITIALCQFCVYALINNRLGKDMLGVWSLLIAATSIGQISNFGFSNSLIRFLPEMLSKKDEDGIQKMIGTINSASFFLVLPVLIVIYFPAVYYGKVLLDPELFRIFEPLMIISLISLFVNNFFQVYSYTFDSMEKHSVRALIQISGWILFLIFSILLIPRFNLLGVSIAMLIQNIAQLLVILYFTAKSRVFEQIFPFVFDKPSFRKIYSFGINSQAINILTIFFDPIIKYFITNNLGLAATGTFEIANKIAIQLRNLLVSANQVIIPKIVIHKGTHTLADYFKRIETTNTILAATAGVFVILIAPLATYLFSPQFDWLLLSCILILNLGWTFNTSTSIHYYSAIGLDQINKLVISHLIQAGAVLILYLLVQHYGGNFLFYFIIPSIALFLGSIYNSYAVSRTLKNSFSWLKSAYLIYFVIGTIILLILLQYSYTVFFIAFAAFILLYIYRVYFRVRKIQFEQFILPHG